MTIKATRDLVIGDAVIMDGEKFRVAQSFPEAEGWVVGLVRISDGFGVDVDFDPSDVDEPMWEMA